ncbi:F0F1 ATP synthase subunit epsilon [Persicimonas caeni]|uniref:F0F1 ATP synthase subunit epsilon n=1 Tax=Persicimonas caeni TaxID=2292766 RepID=A0A4Y6Q2N7_PERCE|nr:F0F1 ATP synthase subunit epsilon [Persicimonas caeni]QED36070.1 F0F1 ATP synthase subunit epsilon [Persicimonas caeni]
MRLRIALPHQVLVDEAARKVICEAPNGSFCLLPRHIDFTSALVPGILTWVDEAGAEMFAAVDQGIVVKVGADVRVSVRRAVVDDDLETLNQTVRRQYRTLDENERDARAAAAQLEAGFVRRFLELKERS